MRVHACTLARASAAPNSAEAPISVDNTRQRWHYPHHATRKATVLPLPDELTLFIDGPNSIEKCHLAETLKDILLSLGYLVHPDPNHGFYTPASLRTGAKNTPPIYIIEHDEDVEAEITNTERQVRQ